MAKKNVLIITYYWPPLGGSGVQRWLKFVKYLPQFGWKPYVFTPENPAYGIKDESLQKDIPVEAEIVRLPIWEPYEAATRLLGLIGGKKGAANTKGLVPENKSASEKLISWIRGNIFIPDTRVFWVRPAARFLTDYLKENKIDTIVTTGPPHSMHLIGKGLKRKNPNLKWIADFRDPWSRWGFLESVMTGKLAMKIHRHLEANVLKSADKVVTVSPSWARQFNNLSKCHIHLITNGYDEEDFRGVEIKKTEKFVIRHVGFLSDRCKLDPFIAAMEELLIENKNFKESVQIDFLGEAHLKIKQRIQSLENLSSRATFTLSIAHEKIPEIYSRSSLLLLVLTGFQSAENLPGKIFEYMATGLPVLGIGYEDSDAAALLRESGAGKMIDADRKADIKKYLLEIFEQWNSKSLAVNSMSHVEKYSRKHLTEALTHILD